MPLPLFLDFEKGLDTIELPFIRNALSYFNFGPSILQWFNLFYCAPESCILNNGWPKEEIQRGVRQGCPLSPYLFVSSVEILANKIRQNRSIQCFLISNEEIKLIQYADDKKTNNK